MKPIHVSRLRPSQVGFSLVELLVAVAIGLVVSLAIFAVLSTSQARKRTQMSVNDSNQTGAFVTYAVDRAVRSAGSGYSMRWDALGGCRLNVNRGAAVLLPRATAWPAPFAAVTGTLRLAPVIVAKGQSAAGSDVLITMSGSAGFAESPGLIQVASVTASNLRLPNTIGLIGGDMVLLAEGNECLMEQVDVGFTGGATQTLPLGGTYYTASGANAALTNFAVAGDAYVISLGNSTTNQPQFRMFGVGANDTLFSHDVLDVAANDLPTPVAEGVAEMRALYGVDNNGDGTLDAWVDPSGTTWGSAALLAGTPAARAALGRIVAVRVGLIMSAALPERTNVAPATITLFGDLPAAVQQTRTLNANEQLRRHRTIETVIAVRNSILTATP